MYSYCCCNIACLMIRNCPCKKGYTKSILCIILYPSYKSHYKIANILPSILLDFSNPIR